VIIERRDTELVWLEPTNESIVGRVGWCRTPLWPALWYGPERGWEPVKEKK
jgi:hypothetical protein